MTRTAFEKTPCTVLIVDDESSILRTLDRLLRPEYEVVVASSPDQAREVFSRKNVDIIITDQRMPRENGVSLLEWVCNSHPETTRILMTGYAELEEAVAAINRGRIFRYLLKPWQSDDLLATLNDAREDVQRRAEKLRLEMQNEALVNELKLVNSDLENRVRERTQELQQANSLLEQNTIELQRLNNRLAQHGKQLEEANHELELKNKMLEDLALTDPLTGLPNRRAMDRLAERELRRRERYPHHVALGMIDADFFRKINEQYLHPGGDAVLTQLARVLRNSVRDVDFIGRVGGEEFLLIIPETDFSGAKTLGERIRSTVENNVFCYQESQIPVTISLGLAVAEQGITAEYETIRECAAAALHEAKKTRNTCIVWPFDKYLEEKTRRFQALNENHRGDGSGGNHLQGKLTAFFQPIWNILQKAIVSNKPPFPGK